MTSFANIRGARLRAAASGLALIVALGSAPAFAQVNDPNNAADAPATGQTVDDPAASEGEILVTGTRASLQSAIARKKNAATVVDSIVADDIASFPDKNVGEALARITGVQLSRDFGEGTAVSIRGVEPDLNRVEINGVSQQSALGGRSGDFRELAVELVKSIDVYKGYSVDLTEGGIGGTVSIQTRRPLELVKPIFSVSASAQRLDLTETIKPRFNLTAGRSDLLNGKLGVIFNATYSDVDLRQDYASNTNWNRLADFDRSNEKTIADPTYANFGTYESCAGVAGATAAARQSNRLACETQFFDWMPTVARYRKLDRNDKRTSVDLSVQYEFADNFSAWGQAQANFRKNTLQDANYSVDLGQFTRFNLDTALPTVNGAASRPRVAPGTFTIDDHVVTSLETAYNGITPGTTANGANSIVGVQRRDFDYNQETRYFQSGFKWELDRMRMEFLGSTSSGKLINNTNLVAISTGVAGITVDRRNDLGIPVLIFPESFDPADPASYADFTRRGRDGALLTQAGPTVQYRPAETGTKEKQLKLDVDYDLDFGPLTTFQFGGQYRTQNYINYTGGGARVLTPAVAAGPGRPARNPVYQTSANVSYNTVIGSPPPAGPAANTYYFTQAQYQQFIAQNSGVTNGAPLFTGLQGAPDGAPSRLAIPLFDYGNLSRYYDLSNFNQGLLKFADGLPQIPNYVIDEDIVAGYAMLDFAQDFLGMRLTGNAGLRYTFTRDRSTGTNRRNEIRLREGTGVNGVAPIYDTIIAGIQEVTIQNEYHDFLPAVNLNLEALPNLFVRATYAKNLARPIPTDLTPAINCNIDLADFVVGEDVCSAGNPALQPYRADQYDLNASWYPNADTMVSVGYYYKNITSFVLPAQTRNGVDLFGDGVLYTVRQKVNGFGAKLDGFEFTGQTFFSFLPAPLDGFGVKGNFTYARALNSALTNLSTGEPLDGYPGLSKYTYNASLLYDKGFLQASLNYNRRSDWLQAAADGNNGNNPIFRRGETFIDAKVQFRISPHYSITIEGQNLGKEFSKTYIDDARPIEYYYPGQRLWLGMQFKL